VSVRALRRVRRVGGWGFRNLHIKADGKILGWITRSVVTGLISEASANDVFARRDAPQRVNDDTYIEIARVNIELFIGRESKAHILAVGVNGLANDDVSGCIDLESSGDKKLRLGMVGIDVVSLGNIE